jgi:hypothetical protein
MAPSSKLKNSYVNKSVKKDQTLNTTFRPPELTFEHIFFFFSSLLWRTIEQRWTDPYFGPLVRWSAAQRTSGLIKIADQR